MLCVRRNSSPSMDYSLEFPFQESLIEDGGASNQGKERKERLKQSRPQFEEQRRIYVSPKVESFSTIVNLLNRGTLVSAEDYQAAKERARYSGCADPPRPRHLCQQEKTNVTITQEDQA